MEKAPLRLTIRGQGITVNVPTFEALMAAIGARFAQRQGFALATVNLDHLEKIRHGGAFAQAYGAQDFVVADGNPIVWLSRLAGKPVALLPGSDLVLPLCRLARDAGVPVALVGSYEAALGDAAQAIEAEAPGIKIALTIPPAQGFDPEGEEADAILARLAAQEVGLCLLALGAPKQEILAARGRIAAPGVGFASIGAGLDFLGGHQQRAPRWVRRIAMEWAWRLGSNPRRLARRYALAFAILPGLAWRALRQR